MATDTCWKGYMVSFRSFAVFKIRLHISCMASIADIVLRFRRLDCKWCKLLYRIDTRVLRAFEFCGFVYSGASENGCLSSAALFTAAPARMDV